MFPLTYVAHIAEEYWVDFAGWAQQILPLRMTGRELLGWNIAGLLLMTLGVVLARERRRWRWVMTTLAGIVLVNVFFHAALSVAVRSYSPGLATVLLLWLPLGFWTSVHEWRFAARTTFWKGLLGVLIFHAALILILSLA